MRAELAVEIAVTAVLPLMYSYTIARLDPRNPRTIQLSVSLEEVLSWNINWQSAKEVNDIAVRLKTFRLSVWQMWQWSSASSARMLHKIQFIDVHYNVEDAIISLVRAQQSPPGRGKQHRDSARTFANSAANVALRQLTDTIIYTAYGKPNGLLLTCASLWADIHDQEGGHQFLLPENAITLAEFTKNTLKQYGFDTQ